MSWAASGYVLKGGRNWTMVYLSIRNGLPLGHLWFPIIIGNNTKDQKVHFEMDEIN